MCEHKLEFDMQGNLKPQFAGEDGNMEEDFLFCFLIFTVSFHNKINNLPIAPWMKSFDPS